MACIIKDDRTPEQRRTHTLAVVMRDRFMSGWGGARDGYSRAAWAVPDGATLHSTERWVRSRGDAQYVNVVDLATYRPPRSTAHFHIYVVDAEHPAARY
jgi:hypothetical protein